jgi:nucleoid DNA-binding protein
MAKTIDLINSISDRFCIDKKIAKEITETLFDYMIEKLSKKERIEIRNFGSFQVKEKKNNLNWINKYSLCNQDFYNVLNYKMSNTIYLKLNQKTDQSH